MAAAKHTEANPVVRYPDQPDLTPFKVYQMTTGPFIVTDGRRNPGARTVWTLKRGQGLKDAVAEAQRLYDELKASSPK